jgi:hypothetical protein
MYSFRVENGVNKGNEMLDGFLAEFRADEIFFSAVKKTLDSHRMQSIIRIIFPAF